MFADWYKNPNNGRYIATVCIQNKHFYASGENLTRLSHNIKQNLWKAGIPSKWVQLSPNESKGGIDLTWADKKFITKYVLTTDPNYKRTMKSLKALDKKKALAEDNLEPMIKPEKQKRVGIGNKESFITRERMGYIEVFQVKRVAIYKKFAGNLFNDTTDTTSDDTAL